MLTAISTFKTHDRCQWRIDDALERRRVHSNCDWQFVLCSRLDSICRKTHIAKILSNEASQEASLVFQRQAFLAKQLETLTASRLESSNPVLIFRLLCGLPIDQWWDGQAQILTRQMWVAIARELLLQLVKLHSLGYVHANLRPEHVWIDSLQRPHLLGMGRCKMVGEAVNEGFRRQPYDAPERSYPGGEASSALDIYSLAVILDRLVDGVFAPTPVGQCMLAKLPCDRPTANELLELFASYDQELSCVQAFAA